MHESEKLKLGSDDEPSDELELGTGYEPEGRINIHDPA